MLKPWVVQALFWFIRAGLLVVLAGTIVITWRIGYAKRKTGVATVTAALLLLAFYAVVGYAGSCLGHDQVALSGGLLSLVTSGWISL